MLKLIKTDAEHAMALQRIDELFANEPPEGYSEDQANELELLIHLIEVYEEEHFPIDLPSPVAAIAFKMDQLGLKQADLAPYFGSKSRVSEVLSGKRPLSLAMMRKLHTGLGIPAEVLLQELRDESPIHVSQGNNTTHQHM
jgi:HTH-type transcriptional regulator / antitoxin HigA